MLTGSIEQTDQTWVCRGPVDLDSVSVTMTSASRPAAAPTPSTSSPAAPGRIGRLDVVTSAADAVKVTEGVHDLDDRRRQRPSARPSSPTIHQDGIQVMGGARITLRGLRIDCGRPGSR